MQNIDFLTEELFCQGFELNTLSEVLLKNEAERWVPGFIQGITEHDHIKRYELACLYSQNGNVLDIACGVGRGSFVLSTSGAAHQVVGCDLNENAIRYAKHRNANQNINFEVQNAEEYSRENFFDIIVSFETIEHLKDYRKFMTNMKKSLKNNGLFIISTPISGAELENKPINPYHIQEWGFQEFQRLLAEFLDIEEVYLQLYQHPFLNEIIRGNNQKFAKTKIRRVLKKISKKLFNLDFGPVPEVYHSEWNTKTNYSKIEKFTNQIDTSKLGKEYMGYQIVVCKNKSHD